MVANRLSGYSGTPLVKKLGIKSGYKLRILNEPESYIDLIKELPEEVYFIEGADIPVDFIHYFALKTRELEKDLPLLLDQLEQKGMIWISWPKKAAKRKTDLDGNAVRKIGIKHGLVDIKVCSVNEVWSGLKFVIPLKDRK
ncbi:MAG: DUF3052 domain-containing protein [Flavobacteriaceae bacterium]|nr:DUF3052 domain-containing protein [Muriicola sp.]NNC61921.1 DUF3052 domain-containing protein [Eudoraea sp.]NNK11057.1 DUF3052 domain-containing protein [Flavobacteriaceae bacterium]NNK34440.1 DUF3052 domain-containing protein [Eudoraea sp.]NNL38348.1 DUF3052 domain-containing protein [Flavobacteriaceae bacterium]